jgi:hypothetical protein
MRAFTRRPIESELLGTSSLPRTDSPSLHPCPASAVLRASSWLAPSRSTSPCGLPVRKTRDASNRLLPPERMTCTHPPYVLDSRGPLSRLGMPRNSPWLSRCVIEATSIFTMPEALWPHFFAAPRARCPRAFFLADSGHERGPVRPAALVGMRPLTPLSRTLLPLRAHVTFVRALEFLLAALMVSDVCEEGRKSDGPAETTVATGP